MRLALASLPVLAAACLASCGETTIDSDKGEKFVRSTVAEQAGVRVKSVQCPDDVTAKKGGTFSCTVTGTDGTKGAVAARQKDDKGNVSVSAPFLHVREAEAVMADQISKQVNVAVKVKCPEVVVVKKDDLFKCEATSGGKSRDVSARLTDDSGRFRYHLR